MKKMKVFICKKIHGSKVIAILNFGYFGSSGLLWPKCNFFKFCSQQVIGAYQPAN